MALSAFGDEIPDDPVAPSPVARPPQPQAQPAPAQPKVSAFGDSLDDGEAPPPVPADQPWNANDMLPESLRPIGQAIDDYGLSLSKGMIGAAEGVTGIGDLLTGGRVSPGLSQQYGYDPAGRRAELDRMATPQHQQAMQQLDRAQGMAGTLQALRDNPSLIPHAVAESLPSMALGGVAGRGIAAGAKALGAAPSMAGVLGAGAGEGVIAAGQQASQTVQQNEAKGIDGLTLGQSGLALASGIGTGLLGAAGARIGRALGVADIDAQLAGANGVDVAKGLVNRALVGTGVESIEELTQSGQQQVLQNLANDRPVMEGVSKQMTMGGIVGGAMGGAAGLRRPTMNIPAEQPAQPEAMAAPAPAAPPIPPQPAPTPTVPKVPFAGSVDISPLLDNLGVQGEQRARSLDLLRPAEQDIEARRRGVVTMDEQRRLANLIGLDGAQAQAFSRKIGQAWNAEQTLAATDLVSTRLQSVLEQQQKVAGGQATDEDRANFVDSVNELQSIFGELAGARAEAGRALAAHRRVTTDAKQVKAILDSLGGVEGADALAAALGEAVRSGGVQNASRLMAKGPGALNKWLGQYWRSALLTGAGTHAVNAVSNTGMLANEIIERSLAAGVGSLKRMATGGKSGATVWREPTALLLGYARNMTNAIGAAGQVWKTGMSESIDGHNTELYGHQAVQSPIELGGEMRRPHMGKLDTAMDLPFRALGTSDAFFRTLNFAGELQAQAHQIASAEKRTGTLPSGMKLSERVEQLAQNPTPAMIERADIHRAQQTFQSKVGTPTALLNVAKARMPWLHAIVPYTTTPANIVKEALKRTPLAPLAPSVFRDLQAGGAVQERAIARMLAGTSVMTLASALAAAGYLTGGGPTNDKEKEALLASGWQPYSIRVGNSYMSYQRFAPLGMLLGLSADLTETFTGDDDATTKDYVLGGLASFAENITNQSYMRGISDLAQFASDPRKNAEWYAGRMMGSFGQPFTLASNAASAMDPYARDTKGITGPFQSRVPFLRESLPVKRDSFGRPVPNAMNQSGPLSMLLPIARSEQSDDPVLQEAARLGWSPPQFQKVLTWAGKKTDIPPEQHDELVELAGQLTYRRAKNLMRMRNRWSRMSDDEKRDLLDKSATKIRSAIRVASIPFILSGDRTALDKVRAKLEVGNEP